MLKIDSTIFYFYIGTEVQFSVLAWFFFVNQIKVVYCYVPSCLSPTYFVDTHSKSYNKKCAFICFASMTLDGIMNSEKFRQIQILFRLFAIDQSSRPH